MHTSTLLVAEHFEYSQLEGETMSPSTFAEVFPDYHPQDRIAIVSPTLEDGVQHTGLAVLALTTAFYDQLRGSAESFFDYPQHFCFVGSDGDKIMTGTGARSREDANIGAPWGNLDVWPESQWNAVVSNVTDMMRAVVDQKINRVFWPENFSNDADTPRLRAYARRMLATRLKSVHYYDSSRSDIAITASDEATSLIADSLARLPDSCGDLSSGEAQSFRRVPKEEFLEQHSRCFEAE